MKRSLFLPRVSAELGSEAAHWMASARILAQRGLYDPLSERANCGIGMIASTKGNPSRTVVSKAIEALGSLWHRGAVDADGKTGDGAGIHLRVPQGFFKSHIERTGHHAGSGALAIGMIFMPRIDPAAQERCRCVVESEIIRYGHRIYGWRQVPIDCSAIGQKAMATRPEIEQIMIENALGSNEEQFEKELFLIRRRIEKTLDAEKINDFYVCSLSCRSLIYKGLFLAEQLSDFYPDLQDARFESDFAIYHQRYSTNTFPAWALAQPFRILAHNGEINTLSGNVSWMRCHESCLSDPAGLLTDEIKPVIRIGSSDSAALDAVCELLLRAGRSLPEVKSILIPEAWEKSPKMPQALRAFYNWAESVMEPWDGPAAICAFDRNWVLAGMDRNGLRPMRYSLTEDGLLIVGSETGMVRLSESTIIQKGHLGPGQMLAVDLEAGRLYGDRALKEFVSGQKSYEKWGKALRNLPHQSETETDFPRLEDEALTALQRVSGWTLEDIELILRPMAETASEATGSMGDDSPLAVLSGRYRPLHRYFRQNFSQVTNPPIDSLRERSVMSLTTRLGNRDNILADGEGRAAIIALDSPVLLDNASQRLKKTLGESWAEIDCSFALAEGEHALRKACMRIKTQAEEFVRQGKMHLFLTDKSVGETRACVPMILATGAVHTHLIACQLRNYASINVQSAECLDVHYFAVLIGVGATTVNPWLVQQTLFSQYRKRLFSAQNFSLLLDNYRSAVNNGLLKIMSKMGISVLSSYRGGYNFETVGLSRTMVSEFFPGMLSRISGIGFDGLQEKIVENHSSSFQAEPIALPVGGYYRYRQGLGAHAWDGKAIHILQKAVKEDSYGLYLDYCRRIAQLPPVSLRDLLEIVPEREPSRLDVDDVESVTEIRKKMVAPGISLGALGPEAHETIAIAVNRIGARSDSGEGGEDPERYKPRKNGDNPSSAIKQIASGRFGVTAEYLNNCSEIEIKMAQGAKPGEGGQLPGFKVSKLIARLRHATPGVTLISPPPHHDIYSIEDLAQLIYDLKQINPDARVCVKLVARAGIGTIAAGVAKAKADIILVSGHSGGTGASPQSSIKYAGLPWEMGVAETHQLLSLNGLRDKVRLRVDGGIKTGRDIVIATMLGAEEYGIGTATLVAMGCIMVRQCHTNACPVGICTQEQALREKFTGSPEKVIRLFTFIAEEVREILGRLGISRLDQLVGRTDLLSQVSRGAAHLDDLDLNPLLASIENHTKPASQKKRNEVPDSLDAQILRDASTLFTGGEKIELEYRVSNTDRAVGARVSSAIARRYGQHFLRPDHLTVKLRGSAGQSLGAWAVQGVKLRVKGDANDYVGKGLSGGTIILKPMQSSQLTASANWIIGNTVLYGASSGKLFAAGRAGGRFAVRNSGALAVVEGCGAHGCEYMTGGTAIVLGPIGANFGAGMTGGMAWVYDKQNLFEQFVNPESLVWQRGAGAKFWQERLYALIALHSEETDSQLARGILDNWEEESSFFVHIVPREMLPHLEHPFSQQHAAE